MEKVSANSFWKKFCKNIPALLGLIFISLTGIFALFAYFIIPDPSIGANQIQISIAGQKPGFSADFIRIPYSGETKDNWTSFFIGKQEMPEEIPIDSFWIKENRLYYKKFGFNNEPSFDSIVNYKKNGVEVINKKFLLGTDSFGRDLLSRLILGGRISFSVGFISVAIALLIGIFFGLMAAYYGSFIDNSIQWLINVIWSIPTLLMVIALSLALGKGLIQIFIAVGLSSWVEIARVVRGQVLSVKEKEYIEAAKAFGFSDLRIMFRHILPNILAPIIVISAGNFASAILLEAGLSFLGLGVQPPSPSWGIMIKEHYGYIVLDTAYLALVPGFAIMLLVMAFNFVGNGLRDALDVKMK